MNHLLMMTLAVVALISFATSGQSATFVASYEAVARGEVSQASDLLRTAVRKSLQDADEPRRLRMQWEASNVGHR